MWFRCVKFLRMPTVMMGIERQLMGICYRESHACPSSQ